MKFVLTIELGNDAMRRASHVAKALKREAERILDDAHSAKGELEGLTRRIRDDNGNTVGEWLFEES